MVVKERELSPLRVFVVLISIQIAFFLYHVALSNPGYVNPAAVVPWATSVSGKLGDCMGVVYGRSKSFVVRSVVIPSVVSPSTMLSAGTKYSEGMIADDIGGPVSLPTVPSTENAMQADVEAKLGKDEQMSVRISTIPPELSSSVLHPKMLSAGGKYSEGVTFDELAGGPVLLPKVKMYID